MIKLGVKMKINLCERHATIFFLRRRQLGIEPIQVLVDNAKLRYYKHLQRMQENRLLKSCMYQVRGGRTSRGRPKTTW